MAKRTRKTNVVDLMEAVKKAGTPTSTPNVWDVALYHVENIAKPALEKGEALLPMAFMDNGRGELAITALSFDDPKDLKEAVDALAQSTTKGVKSVVVLTDMWVTLDGTRFSTLMLREFSSGSVTKNCVLPYKEQGDTVIWGGDFEKSGDAPFAKL